jgi:hypothetical protein
MRAACRGLVLRGTASLSQHCDDGARRLVASLISNDAHGLYQDFSFKYQRNISTVDNVFDLGKDRQARCSLLELVEQNDDATEALTPLEQRSMDKIVGYTTLFSYDGMVRTMHTERSVFGTPRRFRYFRSSSSTAKEGFAHCCLSMKAQAAQTRGFSSLSVRGRHGPSGTSIVLISKILQERHASTGTTENEREEDKDTDNNNSSNGGWTYEEIVNIPNALSAARLVSGPIIGTLILNGQVRCVDGIQRWCVRVQGFFLPRISDFALQYTTAVPILAVSSATDWLDGYFARIQQRNSILGSYLDPLADKVLIGCVVGALGYTVSTSIIYIQIAVKDCG